MNAQSEGFKKRIQKRGMSQGHKNQPENFPMAKVFEKQKQKIVLDYSTKIK